jgi:hypothetical protein
MLAERTGLEPATSDVTGRHSNQLNYHSQKHSNCMIAMVCKSRFGTCHRTEGN